MVIYTGNEASADYAQMWVRKNAIRYDQNYTYQFHLMENVLDYVEENRKIFFQDNIPNLQEVIQQTTKIADIRFQIGHQHPPPLKKKHEAEVSWNGKIKVSCHFPAY